VGVASEILSWEEWKQQYGRLYNDGADEARRVEIFAANVRLMEETNAKNLSYKFGTNQFSDLTREEFKARFLSDLVPKSEATLTHKMSTLARPASVDWVSENVVNPVKDQLACGSCWAFAGASALESAAMIRTRQDNIYDPPQLSFSEQQFVDCDSKSHGCDGGLAHNVYEYATSHAICKESEYSYTAEPGSCTGDSTCTGLEDDGVVIGPTRVGQGDSSTMDAISQRPVSLRDIRDDVMMDAIVQQPVSLRINGDDLQHYEKGVFDFPCSGTVDHAVLAVGYGTETGINYYKVRNSWNKSWGESGYFRLAQGIGQDGALCMLKNGGEYPALKGDTFCSDSDYSQTWNYGCQHDCGCNHPDGSPKAKCKYCCKDDGKCHMKNPGTCPFGFSKVFNPSCVSWCSCSSTGGCDKCCRAQHGICTRHSESPFSDGVLESVNMTTLV